MLDACLPASGLQVFYGVALLLALASLSGCAAGTPAGWSPGTKENGPEVTLPAERVSLAPLVSAIPRNAVQCVPKLAPIRIADDLSNVHGLDQQILADFRNVQKKKLAENGFLIRACARNDFYDLYF